MLNLMKLEIKKYKLRGYVGILFIIIAGLCLFTTIAIYGTKQDHTNSIWPIYRLVNAGILETMAIYSSVLMAKVTIEEYSKRTILIMFTYPINRKKIIVSKLLLVSLYTMISVVIANIFCFAYLLVFDNMTNEIQGSVWNFNSLNFLLYVLIGVIGSGIFSLLPFSIGLIRKSIPATIVSSFGVIFIMQTIISQTSSIQEYGVATVLVCLIIVLFTVFISTKKVDSLDD